MMASPLYSSMVPRCSRMGSDMVEGKRFMTLTSFARQAFA